MYIGTYSDADVTHSESTLPKFQVKVQLFDAKTANVWGVLAPSAISEKDLVARLGLTNSGWSPHAVRKMDTRHGICPLIPES